MSQGELVVVLPPVVDVPSAVSPVTVRLNASQGAPFAPAVMEGLSVSMTRSSCKKWRPPRNEQLPITLFETIESSVMTLIM